jgi:hypothetical protein
MIVFLVGINIAAMNSTGYGCSLLDTGVLGSGAAREPLRCSHRIKGTQSKYKCMKRPIVSIVPSFNQSSALHRISYARLGAQRYEQFPVIVNLTCCPLYALFLLAIEVLYPVLDNVWSIVSKNARGTEVRL